RENFRLMGPRDVLKARASDVGGGYNPYMATEMLEELTIHVDPEAARLYRSASAADRRKLDLLLSLRLAEAARSGDSLKEIMDQISDRARERGMTPQVLREILGE